MLIVVTQHAGFTSSTAVASVPSCMRRRLSIMIFRWCARSRKDGNAAQLLLKGHHPLIMNSAANMPTDETTWANGSLRPTCQVAFRNTMEGLHNQLLDFACADLQAITVSSRVLKSCSVPQFGYAVSKMSLETDDAGYPISKPNTLVSANLRS